MAKQTNVFGVPMSVQSDEEIRESVSRMTTNYVCAPCALVPLDRFPEPLRSRVRRSLCERCGELVYYDPTNFIAPMTMVCVRCAPRGPHIEYIARETSLREVTGWFG